MYQQIPKILSLKIQQQIKPAKTVDKTKNLIIVSDINTFKLAVQKLADSSSVAVVIPDNKRRYSNI